MADKNKDNTVFGDYYKVLQCERSATYDEIKKSYRRLVKTVHPDKIEGDSIDDVPFPTIHEAWIILRDAESRKQYDAELTCWEHNKILIYEVIGLLDMEYNSKENLYTYKCRCGGLYIANLCDIVPPETIVGCDECSFSLMIKVAETQETTCIQK